MHGLKVSICCLLVCVAALCASTDGKPDEGPATIEVATPLERLPRTAHRRRGACIAARHLRQRAFACLASIARAKAPFSSLRLAGSAYCANAPLAVSCRGMAMVMGMERVKTHCRANMRSASANDVPSSRKSISASFFSSLSMRNCMMVDFVASIDKSLSWSFAHNYATSVLQMQEWCPMHIVPCSRREAA